MKLELKHLAPYLPYKLKCIYPDKNNEIHILCGIRNPYKTAQKWYLTAELRLEKSTVIRSHCFNVDNPEVNFKPILRPLSDLIKEIEIEGERFAPIEKLFPIDTDFERDCGITSVDYLDYIYNNGVLNLHYDFTTKLHEWHFDTFNLIENGLAVDINTFQQC